MIEHSVSALAKRVTQSIARRQRVARWAKALVVPTVVATFYLTRFTGWFAVAGVGLFFLEAIAIMMGELQRCPRCEARLLTGRGWQEEFEGTCPECGYPID